MDSMNYNCYVFTTKNVLIKGHPVIRVIHHEDGDWQFLGDECDLEEEDVMVVSLQEIIDYDLTISGIINLPEGKQAMRETIGSVWHIYNFEEK